MSIALLAASFVGLLVYRYIGVLPCVVKGCFCSCYSSCRFSKVGLVALLIVTTELPMTGCTKRVKDDTYYDEIVTVRLYPTENRDNKGRVEDKRPPYFELTLPKGIVSNDLSEHLLLELNPFYPTMEYFRPSGRERLLTKTPSGQWGVPIEDQLRVFLEFRLEKTKSNKSLNEIIGSFSEKIATEQPVGGDLSTHVPGVRLFSSQHGSQSIQTFVYQTNRERAVVVSCNYPRLPRPTCRATTSWNNEIEVMYDFPQDRISEMNDVDKKISEMIDSFGNPPFF
jgi:hypothetical protein